MKRLKILLQWDSSKFVFVALSAILFPLSKTSYLAIILLITLMIFLARTSKNLLIYSLVLIGLLALRVDLFNQDFIPNQGQIVEIGDKYVVIENRGRHHLYLDDAFSYDLGMILEFQAEKMNVDAQNIPGSFDYQTYLLSKMVKNQLITKEVKVIDQKFYLGQIKEYLVRSIENNYDETSATYLKLFLLGEDDLATDVKTQARDIGISHLFAISGMHLSLMIGFISFILKKLFVTESTYKRVIIFFLIIYNIITNFSISILRASFLAISLFVNKNREFTKSDYLSFVLIGFVLYNPYIVFNLAFQLSFLISYAIILGQQFLKSDNSLIQIFKIGLLANLVSLPIVIELNMKLGVMNLVYNVFFVLFVSYLLLPATFLVIVFPFMSSIFLGMIGFFEEMIAFTQGANYFLEFNFPFAWQKGLYWLLILIFLGKYRQKIHSYFYILGLLLIVSLFPQYSIFNSTYVRILDVNQAEAIHIHQGSCDILIDTGKSDDYDNIINYFKKLNIKELDYLVITHYHDDHDGEALDILSDLLVKNLVVGNYNQKYENFNQTIMNEGEVLSCGRIELTNLNGYSGDEENNRSLVLWGNVGGDTWLFTGDIEKFVEKRILQKYDLEVDILKVAHHGSITSSTEEFIAAYEMKYAFISVGKNNYSHPHDEVIKRLVKNKITLYRTDKSGSITIRYFKYLDFGLIEEYQNQEKIKYHLKN
ncbi:MAG: DNA internalization-related competence protein ComEC/Rec2 [Candidatus Izemoplasmatales bacterium]|nr:DNA internalization-related competence protein ComEC/Rec2 [Candidatus Izemoplasmatales bacterium]